MVFFVLKLDTASTLKFFVLWALTAGLKDREKTKCAALERLNRTHYWAIEAIIGSETSSAEI